MRTVAVFKWNGESPCNEEDDAERLTMELARPAAEALLATLRERGYQTNVDIPYDGEGGWHFTVDVDSQTFSIFVMWTGIGEREEDYFAIQPSLSRGCLGTLFTPTPPDYKLEPVCRALDQALTAMPLITHLQWLTDREFERAYCHGDPLPRKDE